MTIADRQRKIDAWADEIVTQVEAASREQRAGRSRELAAKSAANHDRQMHATRKIDVAMVLVFVALMAAALAGIANGILA